MAKKRPGKGKPAKKQADTDAVGKGSERKAAGGRPSSLLDTRVIYCGDCLDQLRDLPADCIDLIYIDPPFSSSLSLRAEGNSNRNYEVFWGETKEKPCCQS